MREDWAAHVNLLIRFESPSTFDVYVCAASWRVPQDYLSSDWKQTRSRDDLKGCGDGDLDATKQMGRKTHTAKQRKQKVKNLEMHWRICEELTDMEIDEIEVNTHK